VTKIAIRLALVVLAGVSLAACNAGSRIAGIGSAPQLSRIEDPTERRGYQPVSLPMPQPELATRNPNSLWRPGARAFFKDQRASKVGDILTVNVNINEKAQLNNSTERTRTNSENVDLTRFLGYEASLNRVLPNAVSNPGSLVGTASDSGSAGTGKIQRDESINLTVAAMVTQILPNGHLVIQGKQEVRVNYEMRELQISGVVRPEDISGTNSIRHTQIAEARIAYGGRGLISDVQQPRYGQQLFDILFPF
jgi:flagellar L-ring protein precursor FlgH